MPQRRLGSGPACGRSARPSSSAHCGWNADVRSAGCDGANLVSIAPLSPSLRWENGTKWARRRMRLVIGSSAVAWLCLVRCGAASTWWVALSDLIRSASPGYRARSHATYTQITSRERDRASPGRLNGRVYAYRSTGLVFSRVLRRRRGQETLRKSSGCRFLQRILKIAVPQPVISP